MFEQQYTVDSKFVLYGTKVFLFLFNQKSGQIIKKKNLCLNDDNFEKQVFI